MAHTVLHTGRVIDTETRDIQTRVNDLEAMIDKLREKDQSFAQSLIKAFHKYGSLTMKQQPWFDKLLGYAENGYPEKPTIPTGDLSAIEVMISKAKESGLKWPKINIETPEGDKIQISMAGPKSRNAGSLNITDGGPFGANMWYGCVSGGVMSVNERAAQNHPKEFARVGRFLNMLAREPKEVISAYGHRSGNCACCNRPLRDEVSVKRGVGPVCAQKWGL